MKTNSPPGSGERVHNLSVTPSREVRRLCAQLGLLTALGAVVSLGVALGPSHNARAGGGDQCPTEDECTFKRPNVLFVLEYSTAMNQPWNPQQTRWEAAVEIIATMTAPGSFLSQNSHLALLRFGHDPDPQIPGSVIPGDASGLVDGLALDLAWDDDNHVFQTCAGQSLADVLAALPAPLAGMPTGIGAWTKGALEHAAVEIAQTKADHPEDEDKRLSRVIVVGSGLWTSADGQTEYGPPDDDPAATAIALLEQKVGTSVFVLTDDPVAEAAAVALAVAGGSDATFDDLDALAEHVFGWIFEDIVNPFVAPCPSGPPRVMILLDASSSMLNVGPTHGAMGETPWDQVREAFRGYDFNFFRFPTEWEKLAELIHVGLAVFGDDLPAGPRLLMPYNRCMEDAFEWALDPQTACEAPGCADPWGGPPIEWTFTDSNEALPAYPLTYNHMPACQGREACAGSGNALHLGLELVAQYQADYQLAGLGLVGLHRTSPETVYYNILITDGGLSTDAQVQAALEGMFAAGVTTYVIGFGEQAQIPQALVELDAMAAWGSGGLLDHHTAATVAELELALAQIAEVIAAKAITVGPCCSFQNCYTSCPPWADCTWEDDGIPVEEDSGDGDGDGDSGDGDGDGDGDSSDEGPGDGDGDGDGGNGDGDGESDSAETGGSWDLPADDGGCSCTATARPRVWPALLLFIGLAARRRRLRAA